MTYSQAEKKIIRLEVKLEDFNNNHTGKIDVEALVYRAVENLKQIDLLYVSSNVEGKREIAGAMFPEKWTF